MSRSGMARLLPIMSVFVGLWSSAAVAADLFINVYTARHYPDDTMLYGKFTALTGIQVRRSEGSEDELIHRMLNQPRMVPADVFFAVDAGTLGRVERLGLFDPLPPAVLDPVPDHLRSGSWLAVSVRARVIIHNKETVAPAEVQNYSDLARPAFRGRVCSRSGVSPYNLGLMASIVAHEGEDAAAQWARGVVANLARLPKGGDLDQIRAVATGDPCEVALVNSYYLAALQGSQKPEDQALMSRIGIVWPNQATTGTHRNISGVGLLKTAPHREAAIRFLEFLVSESAQQHFASTGREWPAVGTVKANTPPFKADSLSMTQLADQDESARRILNNVGYR